MLVYCPYLNAVVDNNNCIRCKSRKGEVIIKPTKFSNICIVNNAEFDGEIYSLCQQIKQGSNFELPDFNLYDEYILSNRQYSVTTSNSLDRSEPRIMYPGDKLLCDNDYIITANYNVIGPKFNIWLNQTKGKPDYKRSEELSKRREVVPGTATKDFAATIEIEGYAVSTSSPPVPFVITDNYNRTYSIYYQLV